MLERRHAAQTTSSRPRKPTRWKWDDPGNRCWQTGTATPRTARDWSDRQEALDRPAEAKSSLLQDFKRHRQAEMPSGEAKPRKAKQEMTEAMPSRDLDRREVHQPRPAVPRPGSRKQHRPDEGGDKVRNTAAATEFSTYATWRGSVRPSPRLDRRPGTYDPYPGAHGSGSDQQDEPHLAANPAGDRH